MTSISLWLISVAAFAPHPSSGFCWFRVRPLASRRFKKKTLYVDLPTSLKDLTMWGLTKTEKFLSHGPHVCNSSVSSQSQSCCCDVIQEVVIKILKDVKSAKIIMKSAPAYSTSVKWQKKAAWTEHLSRVYCQVNLSFSHFFFNWIFTRWRLSHYFLLFFTSFIYLLSLWTDLLLQLQATGCFFLFNLRFNKYHSFQHDCTVCLLSTASHLVLSQSHQSVDLSLLLFLSFLLILTITAWEDNLIIIEICN